MDINFLQSKATDQSYLFIVDSNMRDTAHYPDANNYVISFNWPFENVVGIDLIDAIIPRTEYLVDVGSNTLAVAYGPAGSPTQLLTVPPGDYTLPQLIEAVQTVLPGTMTIAPASSPAEIMNRVIFSGQEPFVIDVAHSTIRRALGLGTDALIVANPTILSAIQTLVTGPLPTSNLTVGIDTPVRQSFSATGGGVPTTVRLFATSDLPASRVDVVVKGSDGSVIASGAVLTTSAGFEQLTCNLTPFTPSSVMILGESYSVEVSGVGSASVYATGSAVDALVGGEWTGGADTLCLDVDIAPSGYEATAPNLTDLTGEHYLLVRCPEVESLMFRDRAYESLHAGLGVVKMGGYGFNAQRFDFVSVPPRRLRTPVGKMLSMTIQLQKSSGTLYNTRGVDHHLVMAIHYREMAGQPVVNVSPIQPAYNPDPTVPWRGMT